MTQAGKHLSRSKVQRRASGSSRTKMNASLAMVVCFVGFQGIVPQSWEAASAVGPDDSRMTLSALIGDDSLSPTGTVGESLLTPFGTGDTLDPVTFAPEPDAVPATAGADASEALSVQAVKHPAAGSLFAPLDELTPTSSFGFRTSPISGQPGEFHTGQDYSAPCGTPVFAADAGTVRAVGWHPWGGGNRVEVDHGNGLITTYNHLQGISVLEGDTVNGGDPIAELGTTGSSTGCHLHFETILDGEHVDPLRWSFVPTSHGERTGEVKDYTPGDVGASDIPAWAQSSTRSDQQPPVLESDILPVASGQDLGSALVDGLVPEAAAEPPTSVPPVAKPGSPVTSKPARPADSKPTASATPKPTASATPSATPAPSPTATPVPAPTEPATPAPTEPPVVDPTQPPCATDPVDAEQRTADAPAEPVAAAPTAGASPATNPAGTDPGVEPASEDPCADPEAPVEGAPADDPAARKPGAPAEEPDEGSTTEG